MIFVTGGTGLVGSHLLFSLVQSGKEVYALKRNNSSLKDLHRVFEHYSNKAEDLLKKINWVEGDILNMEEAGVYMDDISEVYHCAALVSFDHSRRQEMMEINVRGTASIVDLCLQKRVNKFCFVSSISAIGPVGENGLADEESYWKKTRNASWYSWSKFNSELEVWKGMAEGLNVCIVNPSVILGLGSWSRGSGGLFSMIDRGQKFYTDGITGYVDVHDVIKAMIQLMDKEIFGERFILNSENISYKEIFRMIALGLGKEPPGIKAGRYLTSLAWRVQSLLSAFSGHSPLLTRELARASQNRKAYSNEKLVKTLGLKFIPVAESIQEICKAYKEKNESLKY